MAINLVQGKQIATASWAINAISSSYSQTASFAINALTASYLEGYISPFPFTGSAQITGSLGVTGSIVATQGFTGSFSGSGANLFDIPASGIVGLNLSQIISGSVSASISPNNGLQINTNVTATSFTGSLFGTSSFAVSSSYSLSSSFASNSISSSFSTSASFATNASSASNIVVTDDSATDATYYPIFSPSSSGVVGARVDSINLKYNPGTNTLTTGDLLLNTSGGPRTLTMQAVGAGGTEIKLLPNTTAGFARINVGNTNQPLDFQMNNADVMRITQAGDVGIGTTTPNAKLDVNGNTIITGSLTVSQGITGSLFGTSSWATNSLTASYITASNVYGPFGANSIVSASHALTASYSRNLQISGSINNVDYIDFNTGSIVTQPTPGRLSWNDTDGTLDIGLKGGNVTLQIGQEEVLRVVNKTGGNLLESQYRIVRVRSVAEGGAQGQRLAVVLAQGNNDDNSATTLGIVTENIDVNQEGFITTFGKVRNINTTGTLQGETWVDGDMIYLSPTTPGYITNIKPHAPDHAVILGYVIYAHANNGIIFVKVDNGYEIDELHNVKIDTGSLTPGQLLVRSGSLWTNSRQLTGSYGLTGSLTATSFTGSLFGTSSWAQSASVAPNYLPLSGGTIAGSLTINNNLTVLGSASIQYISESTLNIGTNLITVNTFTPAVRFGGLAVIDSGSSPQVSASFLYDSVQDEFLFVHRGTAAGATTSSIFLLGPETYNNLGNETYLTANRIPKGTGIEHLNDSNISDNGSVVSINSNTQITGSLLVTAGITGSFSGSGANLNSIPSSAITGLNLSQIATGSVTASVLTGTGSFQITSGSTSLLFISSSGNVIFGSGDVLIPKVSAGSYTKAILIGAYGTISETGGGFAYITGNSIKAHTANNQVVKTSNDAGQFIRMRYDEGISFHTNITGTSGTAFADNINSRLNITNTGNILIGTTTDSGFKFDVSGLTRLNGNTSIGGSTAGARLDVRAQGALSTDIAFRVRNSADSANLIDVNGAGAVSINSTDSQVPLTLSAASAANNTMILKHAGAYNAIQLNNNAATPLEAGVIGWGNSAGGNLANSFYFITHTGNIPTATIRFSRYNGSSILLDGMFASTGNFLLNTSTDSGFKFDVSGSTRLNGNTTITGSLNITGSSTLRGTVNITPATSTTSSLVVTGPTLLSGSQNTISGSVLTVVGSGSAQPVFTVQGSQGELFSVTDSLSGSLFSVNDISGLPIVEVFSDGTTLMGNYLDPMLVTTALNTLTNSGSFTIYSLPTASYNTAFYEYSIRSGSNARAGQIMAIQLGSAVNYTETTTMDFGSTSGLSLGVFVSGSNMVLTGSAATTAWTIKTIIRGI